ncbi:conserved hypothetical protein [Phenylobacterium zucineum HLK1]|uniref:DUF1905 domain-containing protein n=1 Tax=Phenylobacterium zucineum (strain HLK1) TaxID=450851 RepID=B4RGD3_PHEZH|nr:DUF1905 domain-containing protein [Phenylobacterium zucineum]ACG77257.1 conserved hypothetical protein [Phenylobacterium zucineum HLK1]
MTDADPLAEIAFEAQVIHWRGPSPYFFAVLPPDAAGQVARVARAASYGWGVVPVAARLAGADFTTSLFPRDGGYLLPLKDAVRRATGVTAGDRVAVALSVRLGRP